MRGIATVIAVGSAMVLLTGCTGMELDRAKRITPSGTAFQNNLYKGYVTIAEWEQDEADYRDADAFAMRAMTAAGGRNIEPEYLLDRKIPGDKVADLRNARERLMRALAAGAREKSPGDAAHAQVMFDCWMQEQEENFQPDDIAGCRGGFLTAIAKAEAALKPAAKPMAAPEPRPAARPAPMAKAVPEPAPRPAPRRAKFIVYFPFDSAKITPETGGVIAMAIDAAHKMQAKQVSVFGHADRAGDAKYNAILSQRRATTVVDALIDGGLSPRLIGFGSFGENVLAVKTRDNVPNQLNRRVEIEVSN